MTAAASRRRPTGAGSDRGPGRSRGGAARRLLGGSSRSERHGRNAPSTGGPSPRSPAGPAERSRTTGQQVQQDLDELAAKAEKADEYLQLAQRTQADFENYRKRAARDAALAQDRGIAKLAKELLPAIDNLDRALEGGRRGGVSARRGHQAGAYGSALGPAARRASSRSHPTASRSTRSSTRRWPSSRSTGSSPASWPRSSSRATGSVTACCARRACSWPARTAGTSQDKSAPCQSGPTTTRSSGSARTRPTRRSRRRTASSRASITRTATRATSRRRSGSRRSRRRTTSCPIRTSARSTTAAACSPASPAGRRLRPVAVRQRAALAAAASATSSPTSSAGRQHRAARGRARRGQRPPQARGRDLETEVSLSFDQAVHGTQVSLSVPTSKPCPTCNGSGARPGTSPKVCPVCNGRGVEAQSQGIFSISQPCSNCKGSGTVIEHPCPTCEGTGAQRSVRRLRVNIPAGVRDGSRIKLAGKGDPGVRGVPPGDLYVITRVSESPIFKRHGDNLEVEVPADDPGGDPRGGRSRSRR